MTVSPVTVSAGTVRWAAERVVLQHREEPDENRAAGRCAQCTPTGCQLLDWAMAVLNGTSPTGLELH